MGTVYTFINPFSSILDSIHRSDPNADYEDGRRQLIKYMQHRLPISKDITIIEKYIEVPDGHILFTKCFIHKSVKPKACVFFQIGYGTCVDRPDIHEMCNFFAENGYMTVVHDHLGYGRSDGLWLYIPNSFEIDYVDNANYLHNECKKVFIKQLQSHSIHNELFNNRDPSLFNVDDDNKDNDISEAMPWTDLSHIDSGNNYFLCGQSMGGAVATRLAMKYKNDYKGLVLMCPMIGIDDTLKPPNFIVWIFVKLSYWFPKMCWAPNNDLEPWLCSTEKGKNKTEALLLKWERKARMKTARELLEVSEFLKANMKLLEMDFIVLHGLADNVTPSSMSQRLYEHRKDACDATIKLYDKSYHMLPWEPCAEEFKADMIEWMDMKVSL